MKFRDGAPGDDAMRTSRVWFDIFCIQKNWFDSGLAQALTTKPQRPSPRPGNHRLDRPVRGKRSGQPGLFSEQALWNWREQKRQHSLGGPPLRAFAGRT